jgi:hypothetical protein
MLCKTPKTAVGAFKRWKCIQWRCHDVSFPAVRQQAALVTKNNCMLYTILSPVDVRWIHDIMLRLCTSNSKQDCTKYIFFLFGTLLLVYVAGTRCSPFNCLRRIKFHYLRNWLVSFEEKGRFVSGDRRSVWQLHQHWRLINTWSSSKEGTEVHSWLRVSLLVTFRVCKFLLQEDSNMEKQELPRRIYEFLSSAVFIRWKGPCKIIYIYIYILYIYTGCPTT